MYKLFLGGGCSSEMLVNRQCWSYSSAREAVGWSQIFVPVCSTTRCRYSILKMEAVNFTETLLWSNNTTWCRSCSLEMDVVCYSANLATRCRSFTLKIEAAGSTEMFVHTYKTTDLCQYQEDHSVVCSLFTKIYHVFECNEHFRTQNVFINRVRNYAGE